MSPFANSKTATNLAWQNMHNSKLPRVLSVCFLLISMSILHSKCLQPRVTIQVISHLSPHFLCWIFLTLAGVEDFITFSDTNDKQDFFTCALSLLSINAWDSYATKSMSLEHSNCPTSDVQTLTHAMSQRMSLASSESWCRRVVVMVNISIPACGSHTERDTKIVKCCPNSKSFSQMLPNFWILSAKCNYI